MIRTYPEEVLEVLESCITVSLARNRKQSALASHPPGQTLIQFQADLPYRIRVGIVRCAKHQPVTDQADRAGTNRIA